jgi:hypothetical protein
MQNRNGAAVSGKSSPDKSQSHIPVLSAKAFQGAGNCVGFSFKYLTAQSVSLKNGLFKLFLLHAVEPVKNICLALLDRCVQGDSPQCYTCRYNLQSGAFLPPVPDLMHKPRHTGGCIDGFRPETPVCSEHNL